MNPSSSIPDGCPCCEIGVREVVVYNDEFTHNGQLLVATDLHGHKCEFCGETCIDPDQIRHNEQRFKEARACVSTSS